ncbi:transcriptional regulator [Aeromicrobium sp. 636]|uniref:Helix-turn-helix transcriptional regulator n=1 Tax=Aeromicrobium senzhongii TaxID=2663859 RepID=A0A8I0JZH9_9ACTN|nr:MULTISPECIES: helix-turn-helix domain-containing protein [Aeromicrobium]MBC9226012.1 helix-turn-helix transcriptional regulator [Aeromicrobium senzhongii]MCQ3998119.1 transcriptional regulator [Aeromicrobium sp. 636]MTB88548.1 transcriptional regulator [Aeromicrobium senzhongii]QNL94138.1 helix-turn-helix transcriptional regulator [Aeromicrobium senzhongii]
MATSYGQFCPLAKAMEILDERWTILIVRELLLGSTRFNELRRGVPRMSPALLSKRLQALERHGLVDHEDGAYRLTECGRDLHAAVMSLGVWGLRWIEDFGDEDLDPHLLMWDVRRTIGAAWPAGRTCVAVEFTDLRRAGRWWLVVTDGTVDVCDYDPGFDVTATVRTTLRTLTRVWRGDVSWEQAIRAERVAIDAPRDVRAEVPGWFGRSVLAAARDEVSAS